MAFGRRASRPRTSGLAALHDHIGVVAAGRFAMTGQAQQLNAGAPAGMKQFRQLPTVLTSPLIASDGGAVAEQPALSFGGLLRQLRTQARLTQEELAATATLSPR